MSHFVSYNKDKDQLLIRQINVKKMISKINWKKIYKNYKNGNEGKYIRV